MHCHEWRICPSWGIAVNGSWTSWTWSDKDRRYALWEVAPEVRYYMGEKKAWHLGGMRFVDLRLLNTCEIMGVNIVVTDMEKTVRLLEEKLEDWRGKYICVANVHTTVTAHDDPTYQAVQNGAVMALPDGGPLSKFSREQGYVDAARVTGPDLMKEMLKESADKHYRHYFYGSTQEIRE